MKLSCVVLACCSITVGGTALAEDSDAYTQSPARWQPWSVTLEHLKLAEERVLYRGRQQLNRQWPYLVAANADERAAERCLQVRPSLACTIFGPITSKAAAQELSALLGAGTPIPDLKTYRSLERVARGLKPAAAGWGIEIRDDAPTSFGVSVSDGLDAWIVERLVYVSEGYGRLVVESQRFTVPFQGFADPDQGAPSCERTVWIEGPPQAWQTAGDVDEAEQRAFYEEVARFRAAVAKELAALRTLKAFRDAARLPAATFAQVRWRVGEPDEDLGSGIHVYRYTLADGSRVTFGSADDDARLIYARHEAGDGEAAVVTDLLAPR